jgi:hypothetical protein
MPESQVTDSKDVPRGTNLEAAYVPAYAGEEQPISIEEAARQLRMEPKRLLGHCTSQRPWMPISDGRWVYPSSLAAVRAKVEADRAADHSSGGAP